MATVTVTHAKVTTGTTNDDVEVDLADWNDSHVVAGLENVDNTSDANKPVSTATQTALDLKAPLASPTFTGVPAAPTAAAATSTTQIATTEFVTTADNLKANLASPTFTGVPAAPTAAPATNTTQIATTAFVLANAGATPGGSTTQVQYNNAGALGGITGATTDGTALTLVAPVLGTPASGTLTNATGLPVSTGISGLGTGIATALAVNTGSAGAPVLLGGDLGTPSSGTVTNLTGTASININGTVGATTPTTGAFTTLTTSGNVTTTNSVNASATHTITNSNGGTSAQAVFTASNGTNTAVYGQRGTTQTTYGILTANRTFMYGATDVAFVADGADFYFGGNGAAQTARIHGDATNLGNMEIVGSFGTRAPVTLTGTSGTVTAVQGSVIVNASGSFTITLPAASSYSGHWIWIKSVTANTVTSASSNIVLRPDTTAGTTLFAASDGAWASLQSDGTNWIVMAGS